MKNNLFMVPHQDDESLTFGAAIRNHLDHGDECHVILYTDGRTSSVRKVLRGEQRCHLHKRFHAPAEEDYTLMEEEELMRYRNDEFRRACLALGVPETHIHFAEGAMRDGHSTVEGCEAVLQDYLTRYPGARVKTFTDLGGNHLDHANMGTAARRLLANGVIQDLRLYVEPYNRRQARKAQRGMTLHKEHSAENKHKIVNALQEYKKWEPTRGQFAIGYHSVKAHFDAAIAKPVSYYHKP